MSWGFPKFCRSVCGSPGGTGAAVTWSLLTVSGYPSMSNENVPSPRDNTFYGPAARVPILYLVRVWPSTNTMSPAWTSLLTGRTRASLFLLYRRCASVRDFRTLWIGFRSRAWMPSRTPRGLPSDSLGSGEPTRRSTERLRTRSGVTNSRGATPVLCCGRLVGGPAHALAWLLPGDSKETLCGDSADSRPTAWNGRSAIWRHNKFLGSGPVHDQDNENDVDAAKSHAKCALKDNFLTSVGTATLRSYSDDVTVSKRA